MSSRIAIVCDPRPPLRRCRPGAARCRDRGRRRDRARRRRLALDGHERVRGAARRLRRGAAPPRPDPGGDRRPARPGRLRLLRMVRRGAGRHADPLAHHRRPGGGGGDGRRDRGDPGAAQPRHLDRAGALLRDRADRRRDRRTAPGASSTCPATAPTTSARRSPAPATRRSPAASPSTGCRSWRRPARCPTSTSTTRIAWSAARASFVLVATHRRGTRPHHPPQADHGDQRHRARAADHPRRLRADRLPDRREALPPARLGHDALGRGLINLQP